METPLITPPPDVVKISPTMGMVSSIVTPNLLFVITTVVTVYSYFAAASNAKWYGRRIDNITLASWSASLSVVFALGLLSLRSGPSISYWAALPIIPAALIYGQIAELSGLQLSLADITKTSQGVTALIVSTIFAFIYVVYIVYNLIGKSYYEIFKYLLPVVIFLIWSLLWLSTKDSYTKEVKRPQDVYVHEQLSPTASRGYSAIRYDIKNKSQEYTFRMHHWMLALLGFFISKHQTIVSDLGLGLFWGIFVQSLASYGIDIPVD